MVQITFTCPKTTFKVQHWLDESDDARDDEYVQVDCPACAKLHLINRKTGKMLGAKD
jgi:hypothetical protein